MAVRELARRWNLGYDAKCYECDNNAFCITDERLSTAKQQEEIVNSEIRP